MDSVSDLVQEEEIKMKGKEEMSVFYFFLVGPPLILTSLL